MKEELVYNKLVRDKIPEIIALDGALAVTDIIPHLEFRAALLKKLVEDANKCAEKPSLGEFADLLEVMRTYLALDNRTINDVAIVADAKKESRGGFDKRIILKSVIQDASAL